MKLIDKDALVAEIERMLHETVNNTDGSPYYGGRAGAFTAILSFINTLEVKEVNSRLSLEDISTLRQIMFDYNRQVRNEMSILNNKDYCKEILKRFKAQKGE